MKILILLTTFIAIAFCADVPQVNVDEILRNDRLLNSYAICLLEGKRCTPAGDNLRRFLPEAIETGCATCTQDQINVAKKTTKYLQKSKPELYKKLLVKYDPDKIYRVKHADLLKKHGIVI